MKNKPVLVMKFGTQTTTVFNHQGRKLTSSEAVLAIGTYRSSLKKEGK